jgi:hypothetical protein
MKPQRHEPSWRVTPDLLDFHIKRAHALREECFRDMWRATAALLLRLKRLALWAAASARRAAA